MLLVDANVLLYAVDRQAAHHEEAREWLDGALSGRRTVAFAWVVLLAFIRVGTHAGVFPRPMTTEDALAVVRAWLAQPTAIVVEPTSRHPGILAGLLAETGTAGNLVPDAHLAALAVEHGCELVSYDTDFARFPGVRWRPPRATGR